MSFILIAWVLNAETGQPLGFDRIATFATPEACITAMDQGRIEHATEGKIRSFQCVREDALGEAST